MPIISNSRTGSEAILIATLAQGPQRNRRATALVERCRFMEIECYGCQRVFKATEFDASTGLCPTCYDAAGLENEHTDTNGDHDGHAPVAGCCAAAARVEV